MRRFESYRPSHSFSFAEFILNSAKDADRGTGPQSTPANSTASPLNCERHIHVTPGSNEEHYLISLAAACAARHKGDAIAR
ncbi:hypothetical protein [Microbulbifer donghaiensis]|uniref:hypothetical protein n=1 Tax=Microbulbifer donghaiensis TaxID=494016 RepID=UPI0011614AD4|nr:hypothetical protein [Microbulbifer donghaiensis]